VYVWRISVPDCLVEFPEEELHDTGGQHAKTNDAKGSAVPSRILRPFLVKKDVGSDET
jgi:hypothetical protein